MNFSFLVLLALLAGGCLTTQRTQVELATAHMKRHRFDEARIEIAKVRGPLVSFEVRDENGQGLGRPVTIDKEKMLKLIVEASEILSEPSCHKPESKSYWEVMKSKACLLEDDLPNLNKYECQIADAQDFSTRINYQICLHRGYESRIQTALRVDKELPLGLHFADQVRKAGYALKAAKATNDQESLTKEKERILARFQASGVFLADRICTVFNEEQVIWKRVIEREQAVAAIGGYENKETVYNASQKLHWISVGKKEATDQYRTSTGKRWDDAVCNKLAH